MKTIRDITKSETGIMLIDIIKTIYHITVLNFTKNGDSLCKFYTIFDKYEKKQLEANR